MKRYTDDFLFHCKFEKNLSNKTIKAYGIDLNQFKYFCNNSEYVTGIHEIDKNVLKHYLESIMPKFKAKTVKRKMATLKAFFNFLQFEDEIPINPFNKLRIRIKEGKRVPRTIDPLIIKTLYEHLYEQKDIIKKDSYSYGVIIRDIAVVELLFATGLRVSELSHLKVSEIDFNENTLRINGKGNKERLVPICSPDAMEALNTYYNLFYDQIVKTEYFFINRLHKRLSEQSIRFMIKKHISYLNINKNITPHMFRHSIATMLLENEVDIRYIQDLLGHSSINTTQIYLAVNKKKQQMILTKKHPRNNLLL